MKATRRPRWKTFQLIFESVVALVLHYSCCKTLSLGVYNQFLCSRVDIRRFGLEKGYTADACLYLTGDTRGPCVVVCVIQTASLCQASDLCARRRPTKDAHNTQGPNISMLPWKCTAIVRHLQTSTWSDTLDALKRTTKNNMGSHNEIRNYDAGVIYIYALSWMSLWHKSVSETTHLAIGFDDGLNRTALLLRHPGRRRGHHDRPPIFHFYHWWCWACGARISGKWALLVTAALGRKMWGAIWRLQ